MNENIHSSESDKRLTHAQTTSTRPSCSPNRYKSEKTRPGIEARPRGGTHGAILWGVICVKMTMTMYTRVHSYAHYNMHVNMHMHVTICMQHAYAHYNMHACNMHMHLTICMHACMPTCICTLQYACMPTCMST